MSATEDHDELVDYDEHEVEQVEEEQEEEQGVQGSYVGLQSASFKDLLLKPEIMRAIGDAGFEHPSEVQQNAIPNAITGHDMIVQAKSGMGKTAVFVLSTLQQIEPEEGVVDTLVLCHTRELAYQIHGEFARFARHMPNVQVAVVFGGVPYDQHRKEIEEGKPHIVIGTPGRVRHLIDEGVLKLNGLKRFVLDECDNLLETLDMRRQVQDIFKHTPHDKQVMLYSATIAGDVKKVCRKFTKNPKEIFVDDKKLTLHGLQQHFVRLTEDQKNRKLSDLLDVLDFNQVVIFVKSRVRADKLNRLLTTMAFPSVCVHSLMQQQQRLQVFRDFREFKHRIMVATNLFGRGVDIERVNIVINYDMTRDSDEYLHRVGRAGRFGTKGLAITFISTESDESVLQQVQDRFEVKIDALPDQIDTSTYMSQ